MKIELRYFASVREALGRSEEVVDLPDEVVTVGDVRHWLQRRGDPWQDTLAEGRALRMALNHQMCRPNVRISDGCEVAFFPPVTGG
ncbi:molybdenum cofactor biosynthesis protein MoaD [Pandoraea terrae]|uniref:Molybdenum cofactor biosynthesis protein MoaD n=1 Tax=Pandoraea terrae TaxID=1537710 RepID=A0A5E4WUM4_9BURK|nr:molybdopterin converting factor subunit 1 [Pandoraea terrae]VVE27509.1 molybdenum cofactor biosynthesis protein MoaD [Pandoraea terrae]